jgi:hypothetical protein
MPVYIEEMTSEVAIFDGELPLTEAQVDKLVKRVLRCLEEKQREARQSREATSLRRGATPPTTIGE